MKILNLYCGLGGNRELWPMDHEVVAVENNPKIAEKYKQKFPNDKVIVTDAHQYLLDHYKEFDFIWSSPPCPTHSRMNINFANAKFGGIKPRYPDVKLWQEIIFLSHFYNGKYAVENVIPYYKLLPWTQYGRHAYWTNFKLNNEN